MKSFLLSILMFIVVFGSIQYGLLDIIDSNAFTVICIIIFIATISCAVYFVGKPQLKDLKNALHGKNQVKKGSDSDEK